MKQLKRILLGLTAVSVALLAVFLIYDLAARDRTAPEIFCPDGILEASVFVTDEELLNGVTATDDRDGDLTGSVVVENLSAMGQDRTRAVNYVVMDLSGNVSRASRTIRYMDYESPRILLDHPLRVSDPSQIWDLLGSIQATSVLDGDLTAHFKYNFLSSNPILNEGSYSLELRVNDSAGGSTIIPTTLELYDIREETIPVELTDYILYLHVNDPFDPDAYFGPKEETAPEEDEDTDDADSGDDEPEQDEADEKKDTDKKKPPKSRLNKGEHLDIDSDVNTAVPGVYHVTYTVTRDKSEAYGRSRLIVVVEE